MRDVDVIRSQAFSITSMALFQVPGWSVPAAPVTESKKRKRPAHDTATPEKITTAQVNVEKLMKRLSGGGERAQKNTKRTERPPRDKKSNLAVRTGEGTEVKESGRQKERRTKRSAVGNHPAADATTRPPINPPSKKKPKKSRDKDGPRHAAAQSPNYEQAETTPAAKLTTLQSGMKQNLEGARFRWVNELLYKSDSVEAHNLMRDDPNVFAEYHKGFRHQVESWPSNPVSHYITSLSSYPSSTVIADLGCGDAALARALIPKGFTVLSYDLVSDGAFVAEADIFGRLPLPGSEDDQPGDSAGQGHAQVVNVAVFALSLMGTNWPSAIREAWRVLRPGGELKIAEVASRFTDAEQFNSTIASFGFRFKSTDDSNTHFTLFEFKKIPRKAKSDKEWSKLLSRGDLLKPCEYKRR
ncbi:hypothetical protein FA95DRAFT_1552962 [Auriscalpium vulgare]|uniref:Uncharacterized protein n=1 Tax=Auriscalpium vulgare TaxID=40419 RepID=A0ACB8SA50_9AGAM|nr:hypothetical protein FA95DRAFT_1552962 [Auriscalpium vulgare]